MASAGKRTNLPIMDRTIGSTFPLAPEKLMLAPTQSSINGNAARPTIPVASWSAGMGPSVTRLVVRPRNYPQNDWVPYRILEHPPSQRHAGWFRQEPNQHGYDRNVSYKRENGHGERSQFQPLLPVEAFADCQCDEGIVWRKAPCRTVLVTGGSTRSPRANQVGDQCNSVECHNEYDRKAGGHFT